MEALSIYYNFYAVVCEIMFGNKGGRSSLAWCTAGAMSHTDRERGSSLPPHTHDHIISCQSLGPYKVSQT